MLLLPALVLSAKVQFGHYVIPFLNYNGRTEHVREFANGMNNFTDEVSTTFLIIALLFVAFGKLKRENQLIGKIRMHAFYWSAVITWAATALYLAIASLPIVAGNKSRLLDFVSQIGAYAVLNNFLIPIVLFMPVFWFLKRKIKQEQQLRRLYLLPYMPFNLIGKGGTLLFMLFLIVSELFSTKYNIYSGISMLFPAVLALWTCSKERLEDEVFFEIRLKALQISFLAHYILFVVTYWLVYGWDYFDALFCSIISMQLIFLVIFYWMKNKASKPTEQISQIQPA